MNTLTINETSKGFQILSNGHLLYTLPTLELAIKTRLELVKRNNECVALDGKGRLAQIG
jgi:hypothetical protein